MKDEGFEYYCERLIVNAQQTPDVVSDCVTNCQSAIERGTPNEEFAGSPEQLAVEELKRIAEHIDRLSSDLNKLRASLGFGPIQ